MPRARQPDTTVQGAAGTATLPACSSAWGWMLKVRFSWWRPFLALSGRNRRDTVSRPGREQRAPSPARPAGARQGSGHAGSASLWEASSHPVCSSRLGELPSQINPLPGPQTQIQGSRGEETEHRSYQRWLSLGHPPQRGTQLDYTGDIARSHCEMVPGGPW